MANPVKPSTADLMLRLNSTVENYIHAIRKNATGPTIGFETSLKFICSQLMIILGAYIIYKTGSFLYNSNFNFWPLQSQTPEPEFQFARPRK